MTKTYNTEPVLTALQKAKQVLILLPQNPDLDSVAAGLGLYLSLTKANLSVIIGCSSEMTVNFNRLIGVNKIKPRIGNQNLVISFNYPEDSLEKVAYDKNASNQKFHLTIEPKAGSEPLDASQVEYSYTGSNADLIFVVGAQNMEELGQLYQQEKKLLDDKSKTLVNLASKEGNSQFGAVNLYDPTASGNSEIVLTVLKALNLPVDQDIATNLLVGLESATNNLTSATEADTYETVADLMRLGAKKGHVSTAPRTLGQMGKPSPFSGLRQAPAPIQEPTQAPSPVSVPSPQPFQSQVSPLNPQPTKNDQPAPSPDWLKPKVFKSTGSQ